MFALWHKSDLNRRSTKHKVLNLAFLTTQSLCQTELEGFEPPQKAPGYSPKLVAAKPYGLIHIHHDCCLKDTRVEARGVEPLLVGLEPTVLPLY